MLGLNCQVQVQTHFDRQGGQGSESWSHLPKGIARWEIPKLPPHSKGWRNNSFAAIVSFCPLFSRAQPPRTDTSSVQLPVWLQGRHCDGSCVAPSEGIWQITGSMKPSFFSFRGLSPLFHLCCILGAHNSSNQG